LQGTAVVEDLLGIEHTEFKLGFRERQDQFVKLNLRRAVKRLKSSDEGVECGTRCVVAKTPCPGSTR